MLEGIFWHMVSFSLILPAAVGLYLVCTPKDSLVVRYQNFMLSRTARPLKDEDFMSFYRSLKGVRILGGVLIALSICGFYMLLK